MSSLSASPIAATTPQSKIALSHRLQEEALELQREMERIKERRRVLEEQRRRLEAHSQQLATPSLPQNNSSVSRRSASAKPIAPRHEDPAGPIIPTESERRQRLKKNMYYEMKEAMKASWECDTTTVGGWFLLKDTSKIPTFSRERKFTPIVGQKGLYYLGSDMVKLQKKAKSRNREYCGLHNRGATGCNVNSHWNDPVGGVAPGPGAYTPRFQKLAPPSVLSRR